MCLRPISATLNPDGGRPLLDPEGSLKLPCGKCCECISKRACEWATRAKHEISEHNDNCFITLTYDDDNLKSEYIVKDDFQKFMKNLRKKANKKLSYMVSYEYGSKTGRPHCHAILFGYSPQNQEFQSKTEKGFPLFISDEIKSIWKHGYHSIAEANGATAYYIASYALKGVNGDPESDKQDTMDVSTRPGIGLNYFLNNYKQIFISSKYIPRYYIKIAERITDTELDEKATKNLEKFLSRCNKKLADFPDMEALLLAYEQKLNFNLTNRGSHEVLAKHCINNSKRSLHSTAFRGDYKSNKENYESLKYERERQRLKHDVKMFTQIEKKFHSRTL